MTVEVVGPHIGNVDVARRWQVVTRDRGNSSDWTPVGVARLVPLVPSVVLVVGLGSLNRAQDIVDLSLNSFDDV